MSATTEILFEEIQSLRKQLSETTDATKVQELNYRIASLEEKLAMANQRLNEGKDVLKG